MKVVRRKTAINLPNTGNRHGLQRTDGGVCACVSECVNQCGCQGGWVSCKFMHLCHVAVGLCIKRTCVLVSVSVSLWAVFAQRSVDIFCVLHECTFIAECAMELGSCPSEALTAVWETVVAVCVTVYSEACAYIIWQASLFIMICRQIRPCKPLCQPIQCDLGMHYSHMAVQHGCAWRAHFCDCVFDTVGWCDTVLNRAICSWRSWYQKELIGDEHERRGAGPGVWQGVTLEKPSELLPSNSTGITMSDEVWGPLHLQRILLLYELLTH